MPRDISVVVARYREPLRWMSLVADASPEAAARCRFHVYDKSPDGDFDPAIAVGLDIVVRTLPNVGRESQTYVHHVLNYVLKGDAPNDDDESRVVVFLQGDPGPHLGAKAARDIGRCIVAIADEALSHPSGLSQSGAVPHALPHVADRAEPSFRIPEWCGQANAPCLDADGAEMDLGRWFEHVTQGTHGRYPSHQTARWYVGACFAATEPALRALQRRTWERINVSLTLPSHDGSMPPEAGHFCERSWYVLLDMVRGRRRRERVPLWVVVTTSANYALLYDYFRASLTERSSTPDVRDRLRLWVNTVQFDGHQSNAEFGFGQATWRVAILSKLRFARRMLEALPEGERLVVTDADIQYMRGCDGLEELVAIAEERGVDYLGMREGLTNGYNGGFYILRNNAQTLHFMDEVIRLASASRNKLVDQEVINELLLKLPIVHAKVDDRMCVWGGYPPTYSAIFHHVTCYNGNEEKLSQMELAWKRYQVAVEEHQRLLKARVS